MISSKRDGFCRPATRGMMEWWKNGILGMNRARHACYRALIGFLNKIG
ncbi:MAG: hypothetical protein PVJ82_00325 [Desulfobacteraceae bacterium]